MSINPRHVNAAKEHRVQDWIHAKVEEYFALGDKFDLRIDTVLRGSYPKPGWYDNYRKASAEFEFELDDEQRDHLLDTQTRIDMFVKALAKNIASDLDEGDYVQLTANHMSSGELLADDVESISSALHAQINHTSRVRTKGIKLEWQFSVPEHIVNAGPVKEGAEEPQYKMPNEVIIERMCNHWKAKAGDFQLIAHISCGPETRVPLSTDKGGVDISFSISAIDQEDDPLLSLHDRASMFAKNVIAADLFKLIKDGKEVTYNGIDLHIFDEKYARNMIVNTLMEALARPTGGGAFSRPFSIYVCNAQHEDS